METGGERSSIRTKIYRHPFISHLLRHFYPVNSILQSCLAEDKNQNLASNADSLISQYFSV